MSWRSRPALACVAGAALLAGAAAAQDAPATRQQAEAAVEKAQRDAAAIEQRYQQRRGECEKEFFVNPCLDGARRERDRQLQAVQADEVAARDVLRRLDAEERARQRERRAAEHTAGDKARAGAAALAPDGPPPATGRKPTPPPAADPQARQAEAARKRDEATRRSEEAKRSAVERAADHDRRAGQREEMQKQAPERQQEYEQRQREAAERAAEKERIAEENRQRRERRAQERAPVREQAK
jgi:hypothetical protein